MNQDLKHYCAIWNPDLNINGGWDNQDNIKMIYGDDVLATCHATRVGNISYNRKIQSETIIYTIWYICDEMYS